MRVNLQTVVLENLNKDTINFKHTYLDKFVRTLEQGINDASCDSSNFGSLVLVLSKLSEDDIDGFIQDVSSKLKDSLLRAKHNACKVLYDSCKEESERLTKLLESLEESKPVIEDDENNN